MNAAALPRVDRQSLSADTALSLLVGFLVLILFNTHRFLYGSVPVFPTDDAYITLHNAQVLLSGQPDPRFIGTPALAGSTSLVHVLLTAAFALVMPPLHALNATLWLGIGLYALGLLRLARVHGATPWQACLLTLMGLLAAQTPFQMLNGLETGLTLAGITWSLVAASATRPTRALPVLCALLPLLRPELLALALLLLGQQAARRRELRAIARDLAIFALTLAPFLVLLYSNTGALLPLTIAAKRAYFGEAALPLGVKLAVGQGHLGKFALLLGPALLFLLPLLRSTLGRLGLLFAFLLLAAYIESFPTALLQYYHRYLYVLLPFLWLACASLWQKGLPRWQGAVASGAAGIVVLQSLALFPTRWATYEGWFQEVAVELDSLAKFCDTLPDDGAIVLHDAGYLGWSSHRRLVDMVGLKTPAAIPLHQRFTAPRAGQGRLDAITTLAKEKNGRYLVVLQGWEEFYGIASGLQARGWGVVPLRTFAPDCPIPPRNRYQVWRLTAPKT